MLSRVFTRQFSTSLRRLSGDYAQEGISGANMPFSLKNKYAVVLGSALFFSSGLSFPFYVLYIRTKRGN